MDGVGHLHFSSPAGLQRLDGLEDRRAQEVDPDDCEAARRLLGLFDEPGELSIPIELGDPEATRVVHLLQKDHRLGIVLVEPGSISANAVLKYVIPQIHHEVVLAHKVLTEADGMSYPPRLFLPYVSDLHAELRAVPVVLADELWEGRAQDYRHFVNPARSDVFERVLGDGLVGYGYQLLRAAVGQGPEPGPRPAVKDDPLHLTRPRLTSLALASTLLLEEG